MKLETWLFLDPSSASGAVVGIQRGSKFFQNVAQDNLHAYVLLLIDKCCKQAKVSMRDLTGVAVVNSGATFSRLREVITIANTIAWLYGVPIVKIKTIDGIKNLATKNKRAHKFLQPQYSGRPSIAV